MNSIRHIARVQYHFVCLIAHCAPLCAQSVNAFYVPMDVTQEQPLACRLGYANAYSTAFSGSVLILN
jgi:hypothetical protein